MPTVSPSCATLSLVTAAHRRADLGLNLFGQLPIIHAETSRFVQLRRSGGVQRGAEQAVDMGRAVLVRRCIFHHAEEERGIQRYGRYRGTRLGDHGLQHRNPRFATQRGAKALVDGIGGALQVFLRFAEGAVPIDGPAYLAADIGIGHGPEARCQDVRVEQRLDPVLPVLAAHHGDGGRRFRIARRGYVNLVHDAAILVQRLCAQRLPDRLDDGPVDRAGARMLPQR